MFKKLWKYLSGKKRNIALVYWSLIIPATAVIWPEGAPEYFDKGSALFGLLLSYLGLGHAVVKQMK